MLSGLISAGANLIGGILGKKSADADREAAQAANRQNVRLQKEFAQNSIQWKVEDAKKAGVHPLYAVGAPTSTYTPSSIGGSSGNPLGEGMAAAGQDIGRAMLAGSTQTTRNAAYEEQVRALTLTRMDLENSLLTANIAKARAQLPPPIPEIGVTPDLTAPRAFGHNIDPNPGFSDAETVSNRYGEPAEWAYSPVVMAADLYNNLPPWRQTLGAIGYPVYKALQYLRNPPHHNR